MELATTSAVIWLSLARRADEISYNVAISACEKAAQWQLALSVLSSMPDMNVTTNKISYNAAISSCSKRRTVEADASSVEQHAKHEVRSKSDQLQCSNQRLRERKTVAAWASSREHHAGHEGDSKSAFARIFCDMYCIKDAVKQGDQAILVNLENAVSVLNQNFDSLLEYYTGGIADKLIPCKNRVSLRDWSRRMQRECV
jgi:hypothetical protein